MFGVAKLYSFSTPSKLGVFVCDEIESRMSSVFDLGLFVRVYDPNEVLVIPAAP